MTCIHPSGMAFAFAVLLVACAGGSSEDGGVTGDVDADAAGPPEHPVLDPPAFDGAVGDGPAACPSYDEDFVPLVFDPVCSNCHGTQEWPPDWGVYETALGSCQTIGRLVAAGSMPPSDSDFSLSPSQIETVTRWVALGCPETSADAAELCE